MCSECKKHPEWFDEDNWTEGFTLPQRRKARAIFSVAFEADEFEEVCDAAEKAGKKIGVFIREEVLGNIRSGQSPYVAKTELVRE